MNYITIDGELVTPKTEAMAYEQTNHRMDTLEQNIHLVSFILVVVHYSFSF